VSDALKRPHASLQTLCVLVATVALVCIALELHQLSRAQQAASAQRVVQAFHLQYQAVAQNDDLAEILLRAARDPESVATHEKFRFYAHLFSMFRAYEIAYYQYLDGELDDKRWEGFDLQMGELITVAGIRSFWEARKHWFGEAFRQYIDNELIPASEQSDYELPGS
jgi:hypothetical protein